VEGERAARIKDPIQHSNALTGQVIGAVVGAAVGAALVVASGALAAVTAAPTLGASVVVLLVEAGPIFLSSIVVGAALGKWIGSFSTAISGSIKEGAARTFIGPEKRNAARVSDKLACGDPLLMYSIALTPVMPSAPGVAMLLGAHGGAFIADGAATVLIEDLEAARVTDGTSCAGTIANGCETVFIGGPVFSLIPVEKRVAWGSNRYARP
jgi:uncharacterized Zn-binding protein involved in type VI secretion